MNEQQVREQIYQALKTVTAKSAPNVFDAIQSEKGYQLLEERIIQLMATEDMSASAAITAIETV